MVHWSELIALSCSTGSNFDYRGSAQNGKLAQAFLTSVCVDSTGIWAFTERKPGSCTCRFTDAKAMPTKTNEIVRGLRNIAVDAKSQIKPFSAGVIQVNCQSRAPKTTELSDHPQNRPACLQHTMIIISSSQITPTMNSRPFTYLYFYHSLNL